MKHPTFETLLKVPNKNELYSFLRSWKSLIPGIFVFFFSFVALLFIQINFEMDSYSRIIGLIPFLILIELLRMYYNDLYILGDDTLTRKQGRFSLNFRVPTVKYIDIRGIRITQSIWGRLFGYGDIEIGTSAQDGAELIIENVDNPAELVQIIESFKTLNLKNMNPIAKKHIND